MPFNEQTFTITFDDSLMVLGNTYYMVLVVQKGHRRGTYKQRVTLAEPPPKFNIRYYAVLSTDQTVHDSR